MAIVTDKQYHLDDKLIKKLDMCCARTSGNHKFDNLLIIDGEEGYGKSNLAMGCAYYVAQELKRPFSINQVFFLLDEMIDFAIRTEKQVIVWDEAAFGGLASEWWAKSQKKLLKLLMVARKKQHFYFFLIPKFFKLNEYIIIDRAIGLMHVYAKHETKLGSFAYFKKYAKNLLFDNWKKKRRRSYVKYKTFTGKFVKTIGKVIDEEAYEIKKDAAIGTINPKEELTKTHLKLLKLQHKIYKLYEQLDLNQTQFCQKLGIPRTTLREYKNIPLNYPKLLEK